MMSFVDHLVCTRCGLRQSADELHTVCPADGKPLQMSLDLERLQGAHPGRSWMVPGRADMWRYGPLLPTVPEDLPRVGWTPLLEWETSGVDAQVYLKDEGQAHSGWGWNETGSFKDRGMAMTVAMARKLGVRRLAVPTQGNAGDSLVQFARAAGMDVAVSMPASTPAPIRERIMASAEQDPTVQAYLSSGTIREAAQMLKEKLNGEDWFFASTFAEPGWRIEGKKTLGLEIAEQLDWTLPDVIVYPTGGGTGVLGMWKAFGELRTLGVVTGSRPRMVCIQSDATPPIVDALSMGADDSIPGQPGETVAVGLNVPYGIGHFRVLEILRESGGGAVAVPEPTIEEAARHLAPRGIGPEGAACLASLPALMEQGLVRKGERVVVVNTCGPEKYVAGA
jgi:threonine synthase